MRLIRNKETGKDVNTSLQIAVPRFQVTKSLMWATQKKKKLITFHWILVGE